MHQIEAFKVNAIYHRHSDCSSSSCFHCLKSSQSLQKWQCETDDMVCLLISIIYFQEQIGSSKKYVIQYNYFLLSVLLFVAVFKIVDSRNNYLVLFKKAWWVTDVIAVSEGVLYQSLGATYFHINLEGIILFYPCT